MSGPSRSLSVGDECPECGRMVTETASAGLLAYCWWCNDRTHRDGSPFGWTQTVYNRPAKVERVYGEQARIRFQDNGILDYVPLDALGVVVNGE